MSKPLKCSSSSSSSITSRQHAINTILQHTKLTSVYFISWPADKYQKLHVFGSKVIYYIQGPAQGLTLLAG